MNEEISARCSLFISGTAELRRNFRLDNGYTHPLCAWFFADAQKPADTVALKLGRTLIRASTGAFSAFRTESMPALAALIALESTPTSSFESIREGYAVLRRQFRASSYLPITAYLANKQRGDRSHEDFAVGIGEICRRLRAMRSGLSGRITNGEETCYAALLASLGQNFDDTAEHTKACFLELKKFFKCKTDILWQAAYLLALTSENVQKKVAHLREFCQALRCRGIKFGNGIEFPVIVLLSLTEDIQKTADTVKTVSTRLLSERGFGVMFGAHQRFIYSLLLASSVCAEIQSSNVLKYASILTATVAEAQSEAAFMSTIFN